MMAEFIASDWKWSGLAFLGIMMFAFVLAGVFYIVVNWGSEADQTNDRCAFCGEPIRGYPCATLYKPEGTHRVCADCIKNQR